MFLVITRNHLEITRNYLVITRNYLVITRNYLVITRNYLVITRNLSRYYEKLSRNYEISSTKKMITSVVPRPWNIVVIISLCVCRVKGIHDKHERLSWPRLWFPWIHNVYRGDNLLPLESCIRFINGTDY